MKTPIFLVNPHPKWWIFQPAMLVCRTVVGIASCYLSDFFVASSNWKSPPQKNMSGILVNTYNYHYYTVDLNTFQTARTLFGAKVIKVCWVFNLRKKPGGMATWRKMKGEFPGPKGGSVELEPPETKSWKWLSSWRRPPKIRMTMENHHIGSMVHGSIKCTIDLHTTLQGVVWKNPKGLF